MMLLELSKISLDSPLDQSGQCLVLAELVLPRNAIQSKTALREVSVKKGQRSLARAPFYEKALLKEKVDGRFGLKVSITRPMGHRERSRFLRQLLATGIEEGADALSFPASILGGLAAELLSEATDQLADRITDDSPAFIAAGGLDLDSETLQSGTLSIPLKLTQSFRSSQHLKLSQKRDKRKAESKTYRAGTKVGELRLKLEA